MAWMTNITSLAGVAAGLLLVVGSPSNAWAQVGSCASCHLQLQPPGLVAAESWDSHREHAEVWQNSAHRDNKVGCQQCHRGTSDTMDLRSAHDTVLSSRNPASQTNAGNIAATCGGCHRLAADTFQLSAHYHLAATVAGAPTCTTCHGAAGGQRSPQVQSIDQQCASCHRLEGSAPASQAETYVAGLRDVLAQMHRHLQSVRARIGRMEPSNRRQRFERELADAEATIDRAGAAWHAFTPANEGTVNDAATVILNLFNDVTRP